MTDKQMIEKIEEIIAPYQTEIELDCLSLPIAIESILERKEQELEQYKKSKQASYEALQKRCNELELENRKLEAELEEIKTLKDMYFTFYKAKHDDIKGIFFKHKQTLTEIKKIANKFDYWNSNLSQASEILHEIIEKISEVIENE